MVDFRYHALSLVAVFLALGIGIVLGVTIGDSLVSSADRNLRDSLRDDLTDARARAEEEAELAGLREEVIDELTPSAARGSLRGRRIALVAAGELPAEVEDAVEDAVEMAGGTIDSTTVLDVAEDVENLARRVPGRPGLRRRIDPRRGDGDAARLGARMGRAIVVGERGLRALRRALPQRFSGSYRGRVEGTVLYRHPPPAPGPENEEATRLRDTFDAGLVEGLSFGRPLVGVEATTTDPSQVEWHDDHALVVASIDNVETAEGRAALIYVLAANGREAGKGRFGSKDTAERALPDLSD